MNTSITGSLFSLTDDQDVNINCRIVRRLPNAYATIPLHRDVTFVISYCQQRENVVLLLLHFTLAWNDPQWHQPYHLRLHE